MAIEVGTYAGLTVQRRAVRAWTVSFADLLTLILCFFVSILAVVFERHARAQSAQRVEQEAGTSIAESQSDVVVTVLPSRAFLGAEHFDSEGSYLSEVGRNYLEQLRKQTLVAAKVVRITACNSEQALTDPVKQFQETGRLFAIAGQILDGGVAFERLQLSVPGTGCDGSAEQTRAALALIEVR